MKVFSAMCFIVVASLAMLAAIIIGTELLIEAGYLVKVLFPGN